MKSINVPAGYFKPIRDGLVNVHPDYINIQPDFNIRHYFLGISELATSMYNNGQDTPCIVRRDDNGDLYMVAGERRYRAAKYINEKLLDNTESQFMLSCIIQDMDQDRADATGTRENLERENLTPADYAMRVVKLKDSGLTYAQIGERLGGISEAAAIDYGKLAKLPGKYLKMLVDQPRLKSALIELLRLDKKELSAALPRWASADRPTWGLARDIVRQYQEQNQSGDFGNGPAPADADLESGDGDGDVARPAEEHKSRKKSTAEAVAEAADYGNEPGGPYSSQTEPDSVDPAADDNAAAVEAAVGNGRSPRRPPAVLRFRTAKEIVRFLDSVDHPLAKMLSKHAQGKYSDKLAAKKWFDILGPAVTGDVGERIAGEPAEG